MPRPWLTRLALAAVLSIHLAHPAAADAVAGQAASESAPLQFLKAQPAKLKGKLVDLALAIERETAPLRKDDDVLCRDGLDQMQAGLATGNVKQVTPADGLGKTYEVAPPPDYQPKFLAPSEYEAAQRKARETLRSNLRTLID